MEPVQQRILPDPQLDLCVEPCGDEKKESGSAVGENRGVESCGNTLSVQLSLLLYYLSFFF